MTAVAAAARPRRGPAAAGRPARTSSAACAEIWRVSINDYIGRMGQPDVPEESRPAARGCTATSRRPTRTASSSRSTAMIGSWRSRRGPARTAVVPVDVLRPARAQGSGGRAARCSTPGRRRRRTRTTVRATATDSAQPISNALYASLRDRARASRCSTSSGLPRAAGGVRDAAVRRPAGAVRGPSPADPAGTAIARLGRRGRRARPRAARRRPPGRPPVPASGGPARLAVLGPDGAPIGYGYARRGGPGRARWRSATAS